MLTGKGPVDRSCLVRQAVRMIVEEALESEATQALGSVNSERGAQRRG
jgi:transposase-like protein